MAVGGRARACVWIGRGHGWWHLAAASGTTSIFNGIQSDSIRLWFFFEGFFRIFGISWDFLGFPGIFWNFLEFSGCVEIFGDFIEDFSGLIFFFKLLGGFSRIYIPNFIIIVVAVVAVVAVVVVEINKILKFWNCPKFALISP